MTLFPTIAADWYLAETINGAVGQLHRQEPVIATVEVVLSRYRAAKRKQLLDHSAPHRQL